MWQLAVFALASATSADQKRFTVDGEAFGEQRVLTCTWFTNFENSRFEQCHDAAGAVLQDGDGASIKCLGETCVQLNIGAQKAANWRKPEPIWGSFTVRLIGRLSLSPHQKRYLGDATRTVLIETVEDVQVAK